jgi:RimJ/RimL family protein N-acetyltransferase
MRIKFLAEVGQLTEEDAHTVRVLQQQVFGEVYTRIADMAEACWWVALDGTKPIGFCSLTPWKDHGSLFLSLAGVISGYRGHGLQRRMIRQRERKALGGRFPWVERIVSYTSPDNVWSANNLIHCGYRLYAPAYEWGVENAIYFRKVIK